VTEQNKTQFFNNLSAKIHASKGKKALIFVHGYNVSFEKAARRAAQISYDLEFDGVPIFYSWPSSGHLLDYKEDEIKSSLSVPQLRTFFEDIATHSSAKEIYVIAHSMGTRVTAYALSSLFTQNPSLRHRFKEIALMAPDIDAEIFKHDIAPKLITKNVNLTVYASSNDKALKLSELVHSGAQRLGDVIPSIVVIPGMESIDASDVKTDFIGHSYYGDATSVITDLYEVIRNKYSIQSRTYLMQLTGSTGAYFRFKPQ
jgi:esterase/lipase superfamily enzyme